MSTFREARRLVVKVGTTTITRPGGELDREWMRQLAGVIADLRREAREVILVSSGAIGAGISRLGMKQMPRSIEEKQAAAAVGQGLLVQAYSREFELFGLTVAQVLLTRADVTDRRRYLNARNTLTTLLRLLVVPVVNENDTVAVEEIRFGDNDTLAALVAGLTDSDLLILLSDVDGIYSRDPNLHPDAELLRNIESIAELQKCNATGAVSGRGTGGMATKLGAAKIAALSGAAMVVAHGRDPRVVLEILQGRDVGTFIAPSPKQLGGRKRWIAFHQEPAGFVEVDKGAALAICRGGKSLLAVGIVDVGGRFDVGDLVSVRGPGGKEVGRGLVNYSSADIALTKGLRNSRIEKMLGDRFYDTVIHRDNLVVGDLSYGCLESQ